MSRELFQETIANWQDWSRVYQSIPTFTPLAQEICRREHLPWHNLSPLTPGTNGVFRCGDLVLKIFFPKESGLNPEPDILTETAACRQAAAWGIPTPELVAQGKIADKYEFHYLVTAYTSGQEAGDWLISASPVQKERFVEQLKTLLKTFNRPVDGLLPVEDLKASARKNPRLNLLPPSLREECLARLETLELNELVLTHGDLTGENILMDQNNTLIIIDWADAHIAPAWYELGPIAFDLFRCSGTLWKLFAEETVETFIAQLLDCVCLHDFGPDCLVQLAKQEHIPPFQSLQEVFSLCKSKLSASK